jgi:formate hydrogenlyase subunit 6/NADH:ubiquinone oxidoreductase subunit I
MPLFVMTKTVLKSLFRGPSTRRYPFGPPREYYENTRGRVLTDIAKCIFCGLCQTKCPAGAISVAREEKKWSIKRLCCVTCGYCIEVCPKKCLRMEKDYSQPAVTKEEEVYRQNA